MLVGGGDDLTGALHILQLQLSPPLPSSLAPIKLANPGSRGKMAVKMDRVCDIYKWPLGRESHLIAISNAANPLPRDADPRERYSMIPSPQ